MNRPNQVSVADTQPPGLGSPTTAIVIGPGTVDTSANSVLAQARPFGFELETVSQLRLFHVRGDLTAAQLELLAARLLLNSVGQWWMTAAAHLDDLATIGSTTHVIEIGLRPGVTDREGAELVRASAELGLPVEAAAVGRRLVVEGELSTERLESLITQVLHNEVVERWAIGLLEPAFTNPLDKSPGIDVLPVRSASDGDLVNLGQNRRLGMSLTELQAVQAFFREIKRDPTDGELETIAQTWSEHCSHKTFGALITTPGGTVDGLLNSYLRAATDTIDAPWVRSAFVDNAGIVAFDDEHDLAIKVETHNHPSALEPFGGANTGVGGVVRDILGVSARPVAVTDILCFGPEDLDLASLPKGVLHPRRVRAGVVAGIGDYGNKIGVPNLAGAIIEDETFTTTPLVFAGCIGILPIGSHPTEPRPGDAIVVLGGAVGRDGIGGATFSSQSMGAETAEIAGSSVQIGDPIVEKGLIDLVVAARDARLYNAITDCGAGGLSSAVGEMAETLGAEVDLTLVPRKYAGLAPWEVWLSEAQERMVLAAPNPDAVIELAQRWQVGAAVIGHFTGDGRLVVRDGQETVVDLDVTFLHKGRPRLELSAAERPGARPDRRPVDVEPLAALLALLAHPSIRSHEAEIRTYDHEVLGGTIVRPYGGPKGDGPADGTVMIPPGTSGNRGLVIGIGVNVVLGRHDTEAMAWAVVDEAIRNAVVAGADPAQLSLLDNFAWGNPTDPEMLGHLVAACKGCHDAAIAYGAPFVSGKDSLYNEFVGPNGSRDPVTPTLVITALGIVDQIEHVPLTGVVRADDDVWLLGPAVGSLGGCHLDDVLGQDFGGELPIPDPAAAERHRQLHRAITAGLVRSAHDLSEGGLAVAAAEWALGGRLGLDLALPGSDELSIEQLFGEGPARYLVEVESQHGERFADLVPDSVKIGVTTAEQIVHLGSRLSVSVTTVEEAFIRSTGAP